MTSNAIRIIDVDTHLSEPPDLWTSRAPKGWEERLPRVVDVDGVSTWVFDDVPVMRLTASSAIDADGTKHRGAGFENWTFDRAPAAAYEPKARVELMDELGVWAHILYPNVAGLGSQRFGAIRDPELKQMCVTVFNDAMAEMQEESSGRVIPMAIVPWWDLEASIVEVQRAAKLGLRGIVMCSDPHLRGAPDLAEAAWDPFWAACADLELPVNFHIGASDVQSANSESAWFGSSGWPSQSLDRKLAITGALNFVSNGRVLANLIFAGVPERHPNLKIVSVESGVGWIPFFLEALDYQLSEFAPGAAKDLALLPSEYFRRQMYACFWFERIGLERLLDAIGEDNVLFETDYPHPVCFYPDSGERARALVADLPEVVQRKVLQDNAAGLYRIPLPPD